MNVLNMWGYNPWYHKSEFYDAIIYKRATGNYNEYIEDVKYIFHEIKWKKYVLKSSTERLLANPNYLGYRNGPIPGVHNYSNWCGQRYMGNHNTSGMTEIKETHRDIIDLKTVSEEYGMNLSVRSKRFGTIKGISDWDGIKSFPIHRSWKRSRKKKQWM